MTLKNTIYELLTGFNFDGEDINVDVERYPFRPSTGHHRFEYVDVLHDPVDGQEMTVSLRLDGGQSIPTEVDMSSRTGIGEGQRASVNLGLQAEHVAVRLQSAVNAGVDGLTGNGDQITGNGFDIVGSGGESSGFTANGLHYGWYGSRRKSR